MGFMAIDVLAQDLGISFNLEKTFAAEVAQTFVNSEKVFLVKPQTFMNESGRAVKPLMTYYNLDPSALTVIFDDMDSPVGRLRLREKGSSGGHNGIKSLLVHLGTDEWKHVKIGIGRPKYGIKVVNHVLSGFDSEDADAARAGIKEAAEAVKFYLKTSDFTQAQNRFNK
jgi:PTH1 family peptidyl-tRNA hydrolase